MKFEWKKHKDESQLSTHNNQKNKRTKWNGSNRAATQTYNEGVDHLLRAQHRPASAKVANVKEHRTGVLEGNFGHRRGIWIPKSVGNG